MAQEVELLIDDIANLWSDYHEDAIRLAILLVDTSFGSLESKANIIIWGQDIVDYSEKRINWNILVGNWTIQLE
ncbi:MAG: hypothetical protein BroJett018_16280 [Chloroflexota bacterium]|nr:hypothetical protein [Chloroflexota bacterium]NOG65688.1 hypothetical protein [Chloroflexota bacterium]GIK63834.1 MAG: hypothetical protein BroJett018_16280 [Chloroflexota bacterium]